MTNMCCLHANGSQKPLILLQRTPRTTSTQPKTSSKIANVRNAIAKLQIKEMSKYVFTDYEVIRRAWRKHNSERDEEKFPCTLIYSALNADHPWPLQCDAMTCNDHPWIVFRARHTKPSSNVGSSVGASTPKLSSVPLKTCLVSFYCLCALFKRSEGVQGVDVSYCKYYYQ